jgi:hypothetical protein
MTDINNQTNNTNLFTTTVEALIKTFTASDTKERLAAEMKLKELGK